MFLSPTFGCMVVVLVVAMMTAIVVAVLVVATRCRPRRDNVTARALKRQNVNDQTINWMPACR